MGFFSSLKRDNGVSQEVSNQEQIAETTEPVAVEVEKQETVVGESQMMSDAEVEAMMSNIKEMDIAEETKIDEPAQEENKPITDSAPEQFPQAEAGNETLAETEQQVVPSVQAPSSASILNQASIAAHESQPQVEQEIATSSQEQKISTQAVESSVVAQQNKESLATSPAPKQAAETSVAGETTFDSGIRGIDGREVVCHRLGNINDVSFSDVYITPDKACYCWGGKTNAGLMNVTFSDFEEFFAAIEKEYTGNRSYLLQYKGRNYRVERTVATGGPQYCARKMPTKVPDFKSLGMPQGIYNHLLSLAGGSGLILLAGSTGSGKSTTIASLLKEYLNIKGGYAFTIEDPVELPLDGVYITPQNELGLCKQTTPPDGSWEEGIKSALRSKPRYIYLGEIRSPDIASEALRAATSGHLVLSSIHANNVSEAINSLVKYAASSGISEAMAFELVAGGFLGCVHQILSGAPKKVHVSTLFANPDVNAGCQVRAMIRSGKLNMATLIEQQKTLLSMQKPLFSSIN